MVSCLRLLGEVRREHCGLAYDVDCDCHRHLYAISHSGQRGPTQKRLEKDSAALRVLYELVVSPWPLTLWVNFRTVVNNRTDVLQLFLDILRGPDEDLDLFTRDDDDDSDLYQVLVKENQLGLYPCEWGQYMVEIDLKTWLQISNLTWTAHRPCRGLFEDMKIRLAAVTLRYSLTLTSSENILAPLDVYFDHFPFTTMAYVVDKNYKERSTVVDFESEEFWASLNLENWLSARNEVLCHAVWHTSSRISVLERVQCMHLVLTALPQVSPLLTSVHFKGLNIRINRAWLCMHIHSYCSSPTVTGKSTTFRIQTFAY